MKQILFLFSIILFIFGCSTNNNGTVTVVPLAPTNLTGTVVSTTQINLSWTDNATNEDGYKIERKTAGGNYAVVGSTASNMTTFNDLGLTPNTSYTYRVYAYNSAGNSIQYSNEVTISTQDSIPSWLTNGLVGYWPFNGNANDESGNGNNGTINGATLTSDRFGNSNKAYSFDGISNYINIIDNQSLHLSNFSISVWVNGNDFNGFRQIFSKNLSNSINESINLFINNLSIWNASAQVGGPSYYGTLLTSPTLFNTNEWHHVIFAFSGINQTQNLYVDGNLVSNNIAQNTIQYDNESITIGAQLESSILNYFFSGSLDDIRIYNRALSASEVAYLAAH